MESSDWGSCRDPRRLAHAFDERNRSLKPVSRSLSSFCATMPEEIRKRVLIDRKIKQVHEQFAQVNDPFILSHTNSVYLLKHKESDLYDLVVYLDNSTCAAELNARRELIRLKYREQFNISIDVFEIRISRGSYKDKHPFENHLQNEPPLHVRPLSPEEIESVEDITSSLHEGKMKESFENAIKAQKQRNQPKD